MEKDIENLYLKHKIWIKIVKSFGCNHSIAEDIVQEMYIKIILKIKDGLDIKYNENEINYFYIFRTLNSLYIDLKRKNKNIYKMDIEHISEKLLASKVFILEQELDYEEKYKLVEKELDKLYWYDKKVFEIINGGESIASLSRKTHIAYYSLYNTYTKVKIKLKKLL
jgi:DNA-directed RNA polymerase specialized sigma24 family protein|tara:strand:+ start:133 stop:633 length:501 start_codon:yes stop_codon:yes gene_type:complete